MSTDIAACGIDIGTVTIKGTAIDSTGTVAYNVIVPVTSSAIESLAQLARSISLPEKPIRVGVTGNGKSLFRDIAGVLLENDLVATAHGAARLYPGIRTILEVGGHQSKWMKLGPVGALESFAINDQCAAGSGAFLNQQAGRLKIGIERFSQIAAGAASGASIAGRCSVFAKSDMIHLQQRGTPPDEIAYGLCLALARNFRATLLMGNDLAGPALFCGGGALNAGLYRAFLEIFQVDPQTLRLAEEPQLLGSFGVAQMALRDCRPVDLSTVLERMAGASLPSEPSRKHFAPLRAAERTILPEPVIAPVAMVEAYMGVDVGSVSTNFCLISPSGEVLDGIYLPTRGEPISALREGLGIIRERAGDRLHILGVGTTGSGRHMAGKLIGADVIKNEITCQLLGAKFAYPQVDTILEIGGQDSKFVAVKDGRIRDFVMNKICAAGTGSFLEEQAESLGISIEKEFERMALESKSPLDLGRQCTVFMDTEVAKAKQSGAPIEDILSGLSYSIVRNYMDKVVAGRTIGSNVVFQGGVASNGAVVAAFEHLLGRKVMVHPYNRISGAIGAALAAEREMKRLLELSLSESRKGSPGSARPIASGFRGLDAMDAVETRTFQCNGCSNRCQVVRMMAGDEVSHFGDVCERYTSKESQKQESLLPDLFAAREELLLSYAGGEAIRGTAGIPRSSFLYDTFPFWATFLRSLGYRVVLSPPTTLSTLEEGGRKLTAETCLPIKLTYGHVSALLNESVDFIFLPSIRDLPDREGRSAPVCPYVESAPFMVSTFARDNLVIPALSLSAEKRFILEELRAALPGQVCSIAEISEAYDRAAAEQHSFEDRLHTIGREALSSSTSFAFVTLGKPYNCHDPFLNMNIARLIRKLGVLPVPSDMLPEVEKKSLDELGLNVPWHYNRQNLRGILSLDDYPSLFPVIVSNFGCGPDAFSMKYLDYLTWNRPHLFLEFDEHRGEAGLITRLEAFIDEVSYCVESGQSEARHDGEEGVKRPEKSYKDRRFVIPYFADHARAYVGALRFEGFKAELLPPPDEETFVTGEEFSSGRECHPYAILIGDLIKHVRMGTIGGGDIFFFPGTTISCLLSQYASGMGMALERIGRDDIELLTPSSQEHQKILGFPALIRLWRGFVASDLLIRAGCQIRPYAEDPDQVDLILDRAFSAMPDMIAKDRLEDVLKSAARDMDAVKRCRERHLPLVGVAGDIYSRINPYGNRNLFRQLEAAGLEVWPAPFLTDSVDFGLRKALFSGISRRRYLESVNAALLLLRTETESWRVKYQFGTAIERWKEPGYQETIDLAQPYLTGNINSILLQNVAKMLDFIRRGADGIINAISFHCMMGTISASLTESIRRDHDMIPITTLIYSRHSDAEIEARLEAFVNQVKMHHGKKKDQKEPPGHWWSLRREKWAWK